MKYVKINFDSRTFRVPRSTSAASTDYTVYAIGTVARHNLYALHQLARELYGDSVIWDRGAWRGDEFLPYP